MRRPLFASTATRWPSIVPMNSVLSNRQPAVDAAAAQPRQLRRLMQIPRRSVRLPHRSRRCLGGCTVHITPSMTRGVASNFSSERAWKTHLSSRSRTFWGDLRERAVTMARLFRVGQPVVRFGTGAQQAIVGHLRARPHYSGGPLSPECASSWPDRPGAFERYEVADQIGEFRRRQPRYDVFGLLLMMVISRTSDLSNARNCSCESRSRRVNVS